MENTKSEKLKDEGDRLLEEHQDVHLKAGPDPRNALALVEGTIPVPEEDASVPVVGKGASARAAEDTSVPVVENGLLQNSDVQEDVLRLLQKMNSSL